MSIFMLRAKWSPAACKRELANPSDRRAETEKLMLANNLHLRDMFFSPDRRETVMLCEGTFEDMTSASIIGFSSGSFQDATIESLISTEGMTAVMVDAQRRASAYSPPTEDEIDRMLLDE